MQTTESLTEQQAIESLLAPQEPEQDLQEDDVAETEVADAEEVDEDALDAAEEVDVEEMGSDDLEDDEQDIEEEADEQPETYLVKVDGQEVEVTLDELTQSFSGQKYIQKGMQEAATAKKQAEEVFQALQAEQARVAQLYQSMQEQGFAPEPQMPDPSMAQSDPIGYVEAIGDYNAKKAAFDAQQAQVQSVTKQQAEAQQRAMEIYRQEQAQILARDIPEFSNPESAKKVSQSLRQTGMEYGFSEGELSNIVDARTVKVLHDAMKWRQLQASKPQVAKKAKKARPVTKPKAHRQVDAKAKQAQQLRKRFKETGSVDDAVALLMGD